MTDPIRLARPDVGEAELAALAEVVRTGQLTMGPKVSEFEDAIAHAIGTAHAAAVSSGTAALHLALLALEIGPGDEVIVPAYTFPATANVVELCGARAVLVDVDPDTFNVDVAAVAAAVGPSTRAVMAVHLFGRPVDWEALQTAVPQDVVLVEDAAGALGARYRGTPCGALGVAGCLSFHPRKIVTTGEGGAVTTDEASLDAAVRKLRHHGWATLGDMPVSPAGTRTGSSITSSRPRPRRAIATAGRRTSCSSTAATRRSARSGTAASRPRSGPGRCIGSSRIARRASFPAPTARSSARSRSRSRRRPPRTRWSASRRS